MRGCRAKWACRFSWADSMRPYRKNSSARDWQRCRLMSPASTVYVIHRAVVAFYFDYGKRDWGRNEGTMMDVPHLGIPEFVLFVDRLCNRLPALCRLPLLNSLATPAEGSPCCFAILEGCRVPLGKKFCGVCRYPFVQWL